MKRLTIVSCVVSLIGLVLMFLASTPSLTWPWIDLAIVVSVFMMTFGVIIVTKMRRTGLVGLLMMDAGFLWTGFGFTETIDGGLGLGLMGIGALLAIFEILSKPWRKYA